MARGDGEDLEEHSDDLEGDGVHVDGDIRHEDGGATLVAVSERRCDFQNIHRYLVIIKTDRLAGRVDEIATDTVGV
jgi:hypothetical protein